MASGAPALDSFYVYNASFSKTEQDGEEMIMYYYPNDLDLGRKVRNVGLAQGLVNFTRTFSPDRLCESVRTMKRTQAYFEPEPEYWIVLAVSNPSSKGKKNGKTETIYAENYYSDEILQYTIRRAYTMFRMLHGGFNRIVEEQGVKVLRLLLTEFYTKYLKYIDVENELNLIDSLDGISFMPVDKNVYLRIICFNNLTNNRFTQIKEIVFFFKDQLVWSGLEQDDIRVFYHFLNKFITPEGEQYSVNEFFPFTRNTNGFMTGPTSLDDNRPFVVPIIYVGDAPTYLIIYRRREITCAFMLETNPTDIEFFRELDKFIVPQIDHLQPIINEFYTSRKQLASNEEPYRYIYFNHMNLAIKSSRKTQLPRDVLSILQQIHTDFVVSKDKIHEVIVNTSSGKWVLGKKSEDREIFIIFEDRKDKLNEVYGLLRVFAQFCVFVDFLFRGTSEIECYFV